MKNKVDLTYGANARLTVLHAPFTFLTLNQHYLHVKLTLVNNVVLTYNTNARLMLQHALLTFLHALSTLEYVFLAIIIVADSTNTIDVNFETSDNSGAGHCIG